jgi:hypothetical protein
MKAHWQHFQYFGRHKWYVFRAGLRLGVPVWRLILHDWTKLLPREWFPYTRFFYGDGIPTTKTGGPPRQATPEFEKAWNHHQKRNDHHFQYWVRIGGDGSLLTLQMPAVCVKEMVADWYGAGLARGMPDTPEWYKANRDKMRLHPKTRYEVEMMLGVRDELTRRAPATASDDE